jgi:hypothetical protein
VSSSDYFVIRILLQRCLHSGEDNSCSILHGIVKSVVDQAAVGCIGVATKVSLGPDYIDIGQDIYRVRRNLCALYSTNDERIRGIYCDIAESLGATSSKIKSALLPLQRKD